MNRNRISLLGARIDNFTMDETLLEINNAIGQKRQIHHADINAAKIVAIQTDKELQESINEADVISVDGQAVVWASHILNKPLKERVSGIDLFTNLIEQANQKAYTIFLLGSKQEVVEKVKDRISKEYSEKIVAGYANGYFKPSDEKSIIDQIVAAKPNMLFVGMTTPYKEIFLYKYKEALKDVNFIMGVGGSFDVYSGNLKRAPRWVQKIGMEWFFRLIQDPRRMWKRYLIGNFKFIVLVFKEKFVQTAVV